LKTIVSKKTSHLQLLFSPLERVHPRHDPARNFWPSQLTIELPALPMRFRTLLDPEHGTVRSR
jgi:hypothetical protein